MGSPTSRRAFPPRLANPRAEGARVRKASSPGKAIHHPKFLWAAAFGGPSPDPEFLLPDAPQSACRAGEPLQIGAPGAPQKPTLLETLPRPPYLGPPRCKALGCTCSLGPLRAPQVPGKRRSLSVTLDCAAQGGQDARALRPAPAPDTACKWLAGSGSIQARSPGAPAPRREALQASPGPWSVPSPSLEMGGLTCSRSAAPVCRGPRSTGTRSTGTRRGKSLAMVHRNLWPATGTHAGRSASPA